MPRMNPLGAVGAVRSFTHVLKEIDFEEVRGRAEATPAILLVSDTDERAQAAAERVFGPEGAHWIDRRSDGLTDIDFGRHDLVLVVDPVGTGILPKLDRLLGSDAAGRLLVLTSDAAGLTDEQVVASRDAIVDLRDDLTPALGRRFAELRLAAVKSIVEKASRANAQFALVSNVPAVVPIVGGLVAASADLIVLTKNQIMMVYKIAAIHDRNLRDQRRVMQELAPVVGSGFLWRTIARQAASFLPLAAGTVPKVAIAYVGTMVMGRAADYYYRYGTKPTREQLRVFTEKASDAASRLRIARGDQEKAAGGDDDQLPAGGHEGKPPPTP